MEKQKENVYNDFYDLIVKAWTYKRLTKEERSRLEELLEHARTKSVIKGTYKQRWEILDSIWFGFLKGCGYDGYNWRNEEEKETF